MTTNTNLIISLIILILIIIHNLYQKKKYNNSYKSNLYQKTKKLKIYLYILSALSFIICIIINLIINGNDPSIKTTITYLINSLSIAIIISPLTISNLYIYSFKDEEKYSHTKTLITNIFNKKLYRKIIKAGINIIYLSEKTPDYKLKTINESEIKKSLLSKNIHIKTTNLRILDKIINKENTLKEFNNLESLYQRIEQSRGIHDNYIRSINYIIRTYLTLIITYISLLIAGFPIEYNILTVMILKALTIITTEHIYKNLPFDTDIMERKVKDKNIFIGTQEILFTIFESFCISFTCTIPYMYALSQGGSQVLGNTMYLIIFIYIQLFIVFSKISDSFILINIFKSYKNIRLIIYTIICILMIVALNLTPILNTRNIELQNNMACLLFSLIPIIFIELIKLARYSTKKGKKKNELKNNKK